MNWACCRLKDAHLNYIPHLRYSAVLLFTQFFLITFELIRTFFSSTFPKEVTEMNIVTVCLLLEAQSWRDSLWWHSRYSPGGTQYSLVESWSASKCYPIHTRWVRERAGVVWKSSWSASGCYPIHTRWVRERVGVDWKSSWFSIQVLSNTHTVGSRTRRCSLKEFMISIRVLSNTHTVGSRTHRCSLQEFWSTSRWYLDHHRWCLWYHTGVFVISPGWNCTDGCVSQYTPGLITPGCCNKPYDQHSVELKPRPGCPCVPQDKSRWYHNTHRGFETTPRRVSRCVSRAISLGVIVITHRWYWGSSVFFNITGR